MIFVIFENVGVCEDVFITSESNDWEFFTCIFVELLKLKCYVLTIVL